MIGVDCARTSPSGHENMNATIEAKQRNQDAKTLPAPPAALWTFAVIFTLSAVVALIH